MTKAVLMLFICSIFPILAWSITSSFDKKQIKFTREHAVFFNSPKNYKKLTLEQNGIVIEIDIPKFILFYNDIKGINKFLDNREFPIVEDSTLMQYAFYGSDLHSGHLFIIRVVQNNSAQIEQRIQPVINIFKSKLKRHFHTALYLRNIQKNSFTIQFKEVDFFNKTRLNPYHQYDISGKTVVDFNNSKNTDPLNWIHAEVKINASCKLQIDYLYPKFVRYNHLCLGRIIHSVQVKQILEKYKHSCELQILGIQEY